jgi:hypothetical protein
VLLGQAKAGRGYQIPPNGVLLKKRKVCRGHPKRKVCRGHPKKKSLQRASKALLGQAKAGRGLPNENQFPQNGVLFLKKKSLQRASKALLGQAKAGRGYQIPPKWGTFLKKKKSLQRGYKLYKKYQILPKGTTKWYKLYKKYQILPKGTKFYQNDTNSTKKYHQMVQIYKLGSFFSSKLN